MDRRGAGGPIRWRRLVITGLSAALCGVLVWALLPYSGQILRGTAYASAVLAMPDGAMELLRDRFAPQEAPAPSAAPAPPSSAGPPPASGLEEDEDGESLPPAASASSTPPGEPPEPDPGPPPDIPEKYRRDLVEELMVGEDNSTFLPLGEGYLRNYTKLTFEEIEACLTPLETTLPKTDEPLVLIFHTHATESYEEYDSPVYDKRNGWRSTDNNKNMVAVGDELQKALEAQGIGVIHDKTQHDYPSYNGSYERSAATIQAILEEYPSIQVVLDVHRDGIQREDGTVVKPTTVIDGKKAAQLMIITGCEDGTVGLPNWRSNLRFATAITNQVEQDYPTLMRPLFFAYRKYNMDVTTCSLLLEFGSNGNTLAEAKYCARLAGQSLGKVIKSMQPQ